MFDFSFGKKKKRRTAGVKKIPKNLKKLCKKYRIKISKKVGNKRVYRKVSLLKKLLKKKMRKQKKAKLRRSTRKGRRYIKRSLRYGGDNTLATASPFMDPNNFGYNQPVVQTPGILPQTSNVVTASSNNSRPPSLQLNASDIGAGGINGLGRMFFNEMVPTSLPPEWYAMGQPDGTLIPVGYPFNTYGSPSSFGKRRRKRLNPSMCRGLSRSVCRSSPNCAYHNKRCRIRKSVLKSKKVRQGPTIKGKPRKNKKSKMDKHSEPHHRETKQQLMLEAPSQNFEELDFGKRRRKRLNPSMCRGLSRSVCPTSPNCAYRNKRCRIRKSVLTSKVLFEGPTLKGKPRKRSKKSKKAAEDMDNMLTQFGYRRRKHRRHRRRGLTLLSIR
jgi:hypothetical protein